MTVYNTRFGNQKDILFMHPDIPGDNPGWGALAPPRLAIAPPPQGFYPRP